VLEGWHALPPPRRTLLELVSSRPPQ
jgi:hypothetical protein